jgi:hypothetical protein
MTIVSQASPLLTTAPDVLHHRHAKRGSGDSTALLMHDPLEEFAWTNEIALSLISGFCVT